MAIRTQHSQVFKPMISGITIDMIKVQDKISTVPFGENATTFASVFDETGSKDASLKIMPGVCAVLDHDLFKNL